MLSKQELKTLFENGDIPRQEEFWQWQDSYFHKDENIPSNKIDFDFSKKADLVEGKIPASQLPSYVDDVLEYNVLADFPSQGESGKIYIEINSGKQFRWSGTQYTQIIDTSAFDEALKNKLDLPKDKVLEPGLYNYVPLMNKNDQTTKIISNDLGKYLFKNIPTFLTEEEKAAWKLQMNGGWTANTMSIAMISPAVVNVNNKETWITIKGTNLNLQPTSFSIEIVSENEEESLVTIPNSQVQLYQNGLDLVFYYDFSSFPLAKYKIKISNGIAEYISPMTFSVKDTIENISLSDLKWDKKTLNNVGSHLNYANGSSVSMRPDPEIEDLQYNNKTIVALLSDKIVDNNQDFVLKGSVMVNFNQVNAHCTHFFGLVNANNSVDVVNQTVMNISYSWRYGEGNLVLADGSNKYIGHWDYGGLSDFIFIRRGSMITLILHEYFASGKRTSIVQKEVTDQALKFGCYMQNMANGGAYIELNISELFII